MSKQKVKPGGTITAKDVAVQLGKIIGTPPSDLLTSGNTTLSTLATNLKKKIIGQDQVINEVCALVRQAQLGLSNPERPLASFMFVGKSGVGKTELAKQLANELYHNSDALIKLDMSEFSEGFSSSKLLGSPAGYVGYKESNQFTDKVKLNPYSIVLFDEVDKAHKDVVKLLLQMLENGEVTDGSGKKISLKHAIIILTTTIGSDVLERGAMGFGGLSKKIPDTHNKATEVLKEYFSKEIINRLDAVNLFNPLGENELAKIAAMEMNSFNTRLAYYRTSISADNKTLLTLVRALPKGAMGAREVRRELRARVESLLSDIILSKNIKDSYKLTAKGKVLEVN